MGSPLSTSPMVDDAIKPKVLVKVSIATDSSSSLEKLFLELKRQATTKTPRANTDTIMAKTSMKLVEWLGAVDKVETAKKSLGVQGRLTSPRTENNISMDNMLEALGGGGWGTLKDTRGELARGGTTKSSTASEARYLCR